MPAHMARVWEIYSCATSRLAVEEGRARAGRKKNSFSYASGFLLDRESSPPNSFAFISMCRRDAIFPQSTISFRSNHKLCYAHMCDGCSPTHPWIRFMTRLFLGCHNSGPKQFCNCVWWWKVLTRPEAKANISSWISPGNKLNNINICAMRKGEKNVCGTQQWY